MANKHVEISAQMNTNNKQFKQSKMLQSWLMRPCDVPDIGTKYWKWCPLKSYNTVDCFESKPAGCHYIHTPLKLFLLQDALRKGTLQSIFQSSTLRDLVVFKVYTGVTEHFTWWLLYDSVCIVQYQPHLTCAPKGDRISHQAQPGDHPFHE